MSQKPYDIVIVGAGFFGAVCAYELTRKGLRCLVIDKRNHIGGNCFTQKTDGITIHQYGPHIFHTSSTKIWNWINQFADFNHFRYHGRVNFNGAHYSFPINLWTFYQLWGTATPEEARSRLEHEKLCAGDDNLEDWALSQLGTQIYETFIKGYSTKQWGRSPCELPPSIIKRLPIRFTFDDNYYEDKYQGIPVGGYTSIFNKLLAGVEVRLNVDYLQSRREFDALSTSTLYTGPIDVFFDYCYGRLEYRGLRFEHKLLAEPDFQGTALVNYTSLQVPFTRIIEHKHFEFGHQPITWITKEYPIATTGAAEPFYPVKDRSSDLMFSKYKARSESLEYRRYYFGGRLAQYQYFDMHQVIAAALEASQIIGADLKSAERFNRFSVV